MNFSFKCTRRRCLKKSYSTMTEGADHDSPFKSSVSVKMKQHFEQGKRSSLSTNELHGEQESEIGEKPRTVNINHPNFSESFISTNAVSSSGDVKTAEISQGPEIRSEALGIKNDVRCRYKSQLQNYARRKNLASPLYSSIRTGPAHSPCFKARVKVGGHTFEDLEFFKNLKQAEHAAAKVALFSLACDDFQEDDCVFYKNLLHELSLREGLPVPLYETIKYGAPHMPTFISLVEVEGEVFYGKAGRTKKLAEMKAAKVAYTALIECAQGRSTGSISPSIKADGVPISTLSSDVVITVNPLGQKSMPVSSPVTEHEEDSKEVQEVISAEPVPAANTKAIADDSIPSPTIPSMDNLIGNQDTASGFDIPASPKGGSSSSCPVTELEVSALSISDASAAVRATGTNSFLLCNRVRVYRCIPDIAFPEGITVMPISEDKWVAVSLEFPNEDCN